MTAILTKEQCESLLNGIDHRLTKAEKDAIPTLGQIMESHEALRKRVEELEQPSIYPYDMLVS